MACCLRGTALYLRIRSSNSEDRSARMMRHDGLQLPAMDFIEPLDLEVALRVGGAWTCPSKIYLEDIHTLQFQIVVACSLCTCRPWRASQSRPMEARRPPSEFTARALRKHAMACLQLVAVAPLLHATGRGRRPAHASTI